MPVWFLTAPQLPLWVGTNTLTVHTFIHTNKPGRRERGTVCGCLRDNWNTFFKNIYTHTRAPPTLLCWTGLCAQWEWPFSSPIHRDSLPSAAAHTSGERERQGTVFNITSSHSVCVTASALKCFLLKHILLPTIKHKQCCLVIDSNHHGRLPVTQNLKMSRV